jgi:hypothetical protein
VTRALLILLAACGGTQTPAPVAQPTGPPAWLDAAEPGVAPRPYTVAKLRDGMPVGLELRYRIEAADKPAEIMVMRVVASDEKTGTLATQMLAEDGTLLKDLGTTSAEWATLVRHATFPEPATTVREVTVESPAGSFPGVEYVVRKPDGVTTYRFARDAPGPPVVLIAEKDGQVISRMTLLSRR